MIETHHPTLTTDRLAALLREEIKRNHATDSVAHSGTDVLEILLKVAEDKSAVRTRLPKKLYRFPFTWSKRLQRLFLKVYELLFADQREVNLLLVKALRQSLSLSRALQAKVSTGSVLHRQDQATHEAGALHQLYAELEDRCQGPEAANKTRLRAYLPFLQEACRGTAGGLILDVGCGRGDWLELLQQEGLMARGVDVNPVRVRQCRARGLHVAEGDGVAFLRAQDDASVTAVTGLHMLEHLPFEAVVSVLDETVRILKPGGLALFELPDPGAHPAGSYYAYAGPTGRHPLPRSLLRILAEERGLHRVETRTLPAPQEASDPAAAAPDFTLLGWKD
jgi:SAM-dependent methyltransferase